jgi:hypothetical protein
VRCRSCGLQFHAECDPQEGMRLARHAALCLLHAPAFQLKQDSMFAYL